MRIKKNCLQCGKEYLTNWFSDRSKFCTRVCMLKKIHNEKAKRLAQIRKEKITLVKKEKEKKDYVWVTMKNRTKQFVKQGKSVFKFGENLLTLKNYKEPLLQIRPERGVGWYGTIAIDKDTGQIQCHLCGRLMDNLNLHIYAKHGIKSREYKQEFQLSQGTALVSEGYRMKVKKNTIKWLKTLTPEQKEEYKREQIVRLQEGRAKRNRVQPKKSLEQRNREGTCPDQLLAKIEKVAKKLGHIPTKSEFIETCQTQRFIHLIYTTHGSWANALKMCNFNNLKKEIRDNVKKRVYTDEELLEYLKIYAEENRVVPTASDWRRGLLPTYDVYTRRFGNIENARRLAGVYQIIEPSKTLLTRSKHFRKQML